MSTSVLDQHPLYHDYLQPGSTVKDCGFPWDRIEITNSGVVLPCCFAQETLGNILEDGLSGVLEGARRTALQADVAAGRLGPLCFNAPCPFSRNTMKSEWSTFFPADRFTPRLGEWAGSEIAYHPRRGDGLIFGGPHRFLPAASMSAEFVFGSHLTPGGNRAILALSEGQIIVEVVDETGRIFARCERKTGELEPAPLLQFQIEGYHRQRCEFRAHAQGVNFGFLFKGVRLSGRPA